MISTPIVVDQYSRFMAETFDEKDVISVPTGFLSFFGATESNSRTYYSPNSKVVDIEIVRANGERLAAMIQRGTGARPIGGQKNLNEGKRTRFSRVYPLIEEEGDIDSDQINETIAGESPYQTITRLDRMRALALSMHTEKIRLIIRTMEYLASRSIITGSHEALTNATDSDFIYDFRRDPSHFLKVMKKWTAADAAVLNDIDMSCDTMRANAYVQPDMLILSGSSMDAFIRNSDVQKLADNTRIELITVSDRNPVPNKFNRFIAGGFIPRGRLRTPRGYELWIFTYIDIYTDPKTNRPTKYLPDGTAIICYSGARCDRYFGPSDVLPMTPQRQAWYVDMFGFSPDAPPMPVNVSNASSILNPAMFYFDAYQSPNGKSVTIRTQAAPIFATTQTDAFVTLTGITD